MLETKYRRPLSPKKRRQLSPNQLSLCITGQVNKTHALRRIIAVFNQALSVLPKPPLHRTWAITRAQLGHRVLLIDIDPQASLTIFMGLVPRELEQTVNNAIVEEQPLPNAIENSWYGFSTC